MAKERRIYERHEVSTIAKIHRDNETFTGHVTNLSISGAFVVPSQSLAQNADIEISIDNPLTQNTNDLEAKVVRIKDNGVGLQFKKPLFQDP
jgi:hypothetical protein